MKIEYIHLNSKWTKILKSCAMTTQTEIAKMTNTTYSHCIKIIKELEILGLITRRKLGRNVIVSTTEKGDKVEDHILNIETLIKENDIKQQKAVSTGKKSTGK